ncbi:hypothetical protein EJ04DRAFT_549735 [Polyplosphaeria fusca]|uniref:Polyprenal reductase n=1 Tax=Polyplosphaeria fusca TaxID=682080 RepID=A0A9P4R8Y0_9PLEO|nr:hypothetical protein EJ04DRAFT_549735 [Polyplosphaeria fusca]
MDTLLGPVVLLRTFYLAASAFILLVQAIPLLRTRFLAYGSRSSAPSASRADTEKRFGSILEQALDRLARIRVPHSYFTHFYIVSVACSLLWGWQLWRRPRLSLGNVLHAPLDASVEAVTVGQVQLAWLLMLLQGVRRMCESYSYMSTSKSQMWVGHYLLGILFYLTANVAIWLEAAGDMQEHLPAAFFFGEGANRAPWEAQRVQWKIAVLVPGILTAHVLQHMYHAYLYRLRTEHTTYQLPSHPLFSNLLCPHYTCEIFIYLFLSFLAAPIGRFINWTLLAATVFVAANLGVTAAGTKEWYMQRFGPQKVKNRKRMVPWIW